MIAETDAAGVTRREYVWLNDLPIAVVDGVNTATPVLYYVHTDHLGRPARMVAQNWAWVWDVIYSPFGGSNRSRPRQRSGWLRLLARRRMPKIVRFATGSPGSEPTAHLLQAQEFGTEAAIISAELSTVRSLSAGIEAGFLTTAPRELVRAFLTTLRQQRCANERQSVERGSGVVAPENRQCWAPRNGPTKAKDRRLEAPL
jgi:hypothetical protein